MRPGCFFSTEGFNGRLIVKGILAALGMQVLGTVAASILIVLGQLLGIQFSTLDLSMKTDLPTNLLTLILACVSAPLFEEMLFRGVILKALSRVSVRFGIIASAFLFALFHQNLPQAINAFGLGLVFGYVAYKSGSIIPTILMHFAVNVNGMLQQILISYYPDMWERIGGLWFMAAGVVGLTVLFSARKKISVPRDTALIKKRTLPLFASSWGVILITGAYLALTAMSITKM